MKRHQDNTSQTTCPVGGSGPTVTCVVGSIGAPKTVDKELLSLEVRDKVFVKNLDKGVDFTFALDPMLTYDFKSRAYGVDFPIYLLADSNLNLTGGIRADWTSDKHETIVGVFITKAFSVSDHQ